LGTVRGHTGRAGRIETYTIRVLPVPDGLDFPGAQQAPIIERYATMKRKGQWVMRNCEAMLSSPASAGPHQPR